MTVFRQYHLDCLSHAGSLIGDTITGRAVVVDPQRDIAAYLADAAEHGLTIVEVLETHPVDRDVVDDRRAAVHQLCPGPDDRGPDILDATEGRTVIVMNHRPELFVGADRTVELLDGRCSQRDVPA